MAGRRFGCNVKHFIYLSNKYCLSRAKPEIIASRMFSNRKVHNIEPAGNINENIVDDESGSKFSAHNKNLKSQNDKMKQVKGSPEIEVDSHKNKSISSHKKSRHKMTQHWITNAEEVFERLDWKRLLDESRQFEFKEDIKRRQSEVDIDKIRKVWNLFHEAKKDNRTEEAKALQVELFSKGLFWPNFSHPASSRCSDEEPTVIYTHGEARDPKGLTEFHEFCTKKGYLRLTELGNLALDGSYVLLGPLAELEQTLIRYSLSEIEAAGFKTIVAPDILEPHVIESCGFPTRGARDQVYWLESPGKPDKELCLSGTAEMGISSLLENKVFHEADLPLKLAAVTRCYRAETSTIEEEREIYRVHAFNKVEMYGLTANETGLESDELQNEIKDLQQNMFSKLGLHFRTLEMPPVELGASAHRKFDIEAWMPGRNMFGEISSCSNCTDFQSRRLNIRYLPNNSSELKYVHTVNGTACAVPRMLIALVETHQSNDSVKLPSALNAFTIRSWDESASAFPNVHSIILRGKSQQEKYTDDYRAWLS